MSADIIASGGESGIDGAAGEAVSGASRLGSETSTSDFEIQNTQHETPLLDSTAPLPHGRGSLATLPESGDGEHPGRTLDDLAWIDACQKRESKALGFLPRKALEGKIRLGQVLVAMSDEQRAMSEDQNDPATHPSSLIARPSRLGYLIAADRYFRRDEVGYITQMYVVPEARRSLVAGQLLEAQFERSAWGCKLYTCWCAQDLAANAFWEAMGFTAVAFRTGSQTKGVRAQGRG